MSAKYNESLQQRAYLIRAIIYRTRARKTSNYLSKALGIYLLGSGTKRRVIETLAGLGICERYQCINQLLSGIATEAKVCTVHTFGGVVIFIFIVLYYLLTV
jgi:hypothetical protein